MNVNLRLILLGGTLLVAVGIMAWSIRPTSISNEELESLGVFILDNPIVLGELDLIDEDGEVFNGSELKGKWTYAFFGYTHCPDICPTTLAQMRAVHATLQEQNDLHTLSNMQRMFVSIDAKRDNHEAVKAYTDDIDPELLGVTGTPTKIKKFAETVFVGFEQLGDANATDDYLVNHQGNIIIFSPDGSGYGFIRSPFKDDHLARVFTGLARLNQT